MSDPEASTQIANPAERRLHPLTLIFTFARSLRELIIPAAIALFGVGQQSMAYVGIGAAVLLILLAISAVARYLRYTYRYDADELVVKSGVFFRRERHIPYARIQNVDAVQNPFQRVFGVVVVHVQTGAGVAPEASLSVLPIAALDEMRVRVGATGGRRAALARRQPGEAIDPDAIVAAGGPVPAESGVRTAEMRTGPVGTAAPSRTMEADKADEDVETLLHLETPELLVGGFIDNRAMVVILGALALLERADILDRIASRFPLPDEAGMREMATGWFGAGMRGAVVAIVIILVVLLFVRLLATAWTAVRLYDYRLVKAGENLRSEYGLLTRVTATVPLRRIQVIVVTEGLLHRLLGRVQVSVVTAGGISGQQGTPKRERVAPVLRREQLHDFLRSLQPSLDLAAVEWRPVHPRAFGRMVRASLFAPIVVSAVAAYFFGWWAVAVFGVLLARLIVDRAMRARYLGWSLTGDSIVMRGGGLRRSTRVARFNRIQVVALDQNPFDRRARMADLTAVTAGAGGTVAVPYLVQDDASDVHALLSAHVAASEFTW